MPSATGQTTSIRRICSCLKPLAAMARACLPGSGAGITRQQKRKKPVTPQLARNWRRLSAIWSSAACCNTDRARRYDLHPVVRDVAAGSMNSEDKESYGLRVMDYFSSQPHSPYHEARTMEDVVNGLHVVRTLLKLCLPG